MMAVKAKVAELPLGTGHTVQFSQIDAAWESPPGETPGVYLRGNINHPGRGAVFFYGEPHATALRDALDLPPRPQPAAEVKP